MARIDQTHLRQLQIMKHYRLIRKWACLTYNLSDSDLELIISLDCVGLFNRKDFKDGVYYLPWDAKRFDKLRKAGWIICWRERNQTTQKYNIYKLSFKASQLVSRIYRIMLGDEEFPESRKRNKLSGRNTYTEKVTYRSIIKANKDVRKRNDGFLS